MHAVAIENGAASSHQPGRASADEADNPAVVFLALRSSCIKTCSCVCGAPLFTVALKQPSPSVGKRIHKILSVHANEHRPQKEQSVDRCHTGWLRAVVVLVERSEFSSQHMRGDCQAFITPVPGALMPPLTSVGTRHPWYTDTYMPAKQSYT